MYLSGPASFALILFVILFGIITVVLLGVLAFALIKMQQQVEKLTNIAEPVALKASDTLETVQRVTMSVGEKADHILSRSESLTENVSDRVEKTANVVQTAVTTPLINLSSLITGVSTAFNVYGKKANTGTSASSAGNGHTKSTINIKE